MHPSQIGDFQDQLISHLAEKYRGVPLTDETEHEIACKVLHVMEVNNYPRGREYTFQVSLFGDCDNENECYALAFFLPTEAEELEIINNSMVDRELAYLYGPRHEIRGDWQN